MKRLVPRYLVVWLNKKFKEDHERFLTYKHNLSKADIDLDEEYDGDPVDEEEDADVIQEVDTPQEIVETDDDVGDKYKLPEAIDNDNRDCAFLYLDGDIVVSDDYGSHATALEDYIDERNEEIEEEWKDDGKEGTPPLLQSTDFEFRPSYSDLQKLGADQFSYGHIVEDDAFLELQGMHNCSAGNVWSALHRDLMAREMYTIDDSYYVQRVANINYTFDEEYAGLDFDTLPELKDFCDENGLDFHQALYEGFKYGFPDDNLIMRMVTNSKRPDEYDRLTYKSLLPCLTVMLDDFNACVCDALNAQGRKNNTFLEHLSEHDNAEFDIEIPRFSIQPYNQEMNDIKGLIEQYPDIIDMLNETLELVVDTARSAYEATSGFLELDKQIISPKDLVSIEDKKGDEIEVSDRFRIDIGAREKPFVIVDDEYMEGDDTDTHSILINRLTNNDNFSVRRDKRELSKLDNKVGYGHIANNIAFVEGGVDYTAEEIAEQLQNQHFDKIYSYEKRQQKVKRLAKKRLQSSFFSNISNLFKKFTNSEQKQIDKIVQEQKSKLKQDFKRYCYDNRVILPLYFECTKEKMHPAECANKHIDDIVKEYIIDQLPFDIDTNVMHAVIEIFKRDNETLDYIREQVIAAINDCISQYSNGAISNTNDIPDNEDAIGDTYYLKRIDIGTRDGAFVYADGEIISGGKGESHTQMLNRYLKEKETEKQLSEDYYRVSTKELQKVFDVKSTAFGHFVKDCAIVDEVTLSNCTMNAVAEALKQNGYNRVYSFDKVNNILKRVAYRRLRKC